MVMNPDEQYNEQQEWIQNYLDGKLNSDERMAFEERMRKDDSFREEVLWMKAMLQGIDEWGNSKVQEAVKKMDQQLAREGFFEEATPQSAKPQAERWSFKRNWWMAAAASIALLVVTYYFFWPEDQKAKKPVSIYAAYYQRESKATNVLIQRYETVGLIPAGSDSDSLVWALKLYMAGQCKDASVYFDRSGQDMQIKPLRIFYQALCYLDNKQFEQAFANLSTLCSIDAFEFQAEACWYAAITASQMRHYAHIAKEHFLKVANNPKSLHQNQAQEILKLYK